MTQTELPGMPRLTPLGKKARELVELSERAEMIKEQIDEAKIELVSLFKNEDRSEITVEGRTISYAHLEKDQIKIKNPE